MGLVSADVIAGAHGVAKKTVYQWRRVYGMPGVPIGAGEFLFDQEVCASWVSANHFTTKPGRPFKLDQLARKELLDPGLHKPGYVKPEGPPEEVPEGWTPEEVEQVKADTLEAKLRKERLLVQKHEHQLSLAQGLVVSKDEVRRERLSRIAAVKAKLLALPGKLASRLAGRDAKAVEDELKLEVHDVLFEFSRGEELGQVGLVPAGLPDPGKPPGPPPPVGV